MPEKTSARYRSLIVTSCKGGIGKSTVCANLAASLAALGHRVLVSNEARYTKKTGTDVLASILEEAPVPPVKEKMFHENAGK